MTQKGPEYRMMACGSEPPLPGRVVLGVETLQERLRSLLQDRRRSAANSWSSFPSNLSHSSAGEAFHGARRAVHCGTLLDPGPAAASIDHHAAPRTAA
ncbi:hypothetical protein EYF80_062618 [Liparis tanakae]|uniref:Uncharacterized protein n=1 Tax=Liparis tanakae TaxID=230148 RepID=A0A4Z2EEN1_9TELE|nr:hypothetical protein EYF80_062618 [Liparis tanakae]